jgi:hypothetical protein
VKIKHQLDTAHIDTRDEIDEDTQLVGVWCDTHQIFEWHRLRRDGLGGVQTVYTDRPPPRA